MDISNIPPYIEFIIWAEKHGIEIQTVYASPEKQKEQEGKDGFFGSRYKFTAEFLEMYDHWIDMK